MISYELISKQDVNAKEKVFVKDNQLIFDYPCENSSHCTDYIVHMPRGTYKFELYGASGGSSRGNVSSYRDKNKICIPDDIVKLFHGNTECFQENSIGGAGGYLSAVIRLNHPIPTYFTLGGKGVFGYKPGTMTEEQNFEKDNMQPGGYGGGGSSSNYFGIDESSTLIYGSGSGGGQTAVKFLENDLWHRVLVSGGGGGSDDNATDDGSGGSGGNLTAQGWFRFSELKSSHLANSSFGFAFGQGEAARYTTALNNRSVQNAGKFDIAGAGGGWFGGFSSQDGSSGSGGGSSWALTKDAFIPIGNIESYDEFYKFIDSKPYAFDHNSEYLFQDVIHVPGIWEGNGRIIISILDMCYI
ncbi:gp13, putative [Trichomonas vaginalis G3]|uniref:receptor protein-tyrosine kinase n=1 Tax=Trichomonas vaginalis (strain ATCC PRA-98 / G3) TaxID=412133 RepID=A2EBV6_TRIV3|nr:glycine-rich protein family [Trichomonas vaginalis G3]EAY09824.1 gp13, putative [Trichomonas vaginalis G3]KAI5505951.1 glycine-rich protein family [Trichomonas vaginalis G3]|eukprot:XP_001322047.1 gp13 [Trichomonas vaginalis G3]